MAEFFTIREAAGLFSMSPEALRFYERGGLLRPIRNTENGYRYFDKFTILRLGNCKRLRSLNFSMQETNDSLKHDSLESFIPKLKEKQKALAEKISWDQEVEAFMKEYIRILEKIPRELGTFQITKSPEILYILHREENNFFSDGQLGTILPKWIDKMPLVRIFSLIREESLSKPHKELIRRAGYAIPSRYSSLLGPTANNPRVKLLPEQTCVRTVLTVENNFPSRNGRFGPALEFMQKNNLELGGDPWGFQLFVSYRNNQEPSAGNAEKEIGTVYYEYYLPVKNK